MFVVLEQSERNTLYLWILVYFVDFVDFVYLWSSSQKTKNKKKKFSEFL